MKRLEDMNTTDMADLKRRVDENVAALYAGEDLPHQFTEEESLALRPKCSSGFGIHADGRIVHCGTALMGKTELDVDLWNDEMRIEAGFPPKNSSEEFRAKVRADIPRRLNLAREAEQRQRAWVRDFEMRKELGRLYWLFQLRFVVMGAVFILAWWLLQR
jgi:hypothetical protein